MPYTQFKPFHVYALNQQDPYASQLPFNYFLCLTMPEFIEPQLRFNIVGFPILTNQPRIVDKRLRLPLKTSPNSNLDLRGEPVIAIDLLQPLLNKMLNDRTLGCLEYLEITELKEMALRFLALGPDVR